jgi:hypothetical protein
MRQSSIMMKIKVKKMAVLTALQFSFALTKGQTGIVFGTNYDLRHTLWSDNVEYIRGPYGSNAGMGGSMIFFKDKVGIKLSYNAYREEFRDVVKEEARFFEYFDTITYKTRLRYMGLGVTLNILNKKFTLNYEGDAIRSHWQQTNTVGFAPNKKVNESFTGNEKQFKPGIIFRNGLKMGYSIGNFEISGSVFTDVLLRRYWNHSTYMGAIEPYPRGAIGGNLGLAYNMNFKK